MKGKYVLQWTDEALKQLESIKKSKSESAAKYLLKLASILKSMQTNPFQGIGKPEPLRHDFSSCWSRRITQRDRIIYKEERKSIIIISLLGHYNA